MTDKAWKDFEEAAKESDAAGKRLRRARDVMEQARADCHFAERRMQDAWRAVMTEAA